jgi:hypothetical protein
LYLDRIGYNGIGNDDDFLSAICSDENIELVECHYRVHIAFMDYWAFKAMLRVAAVRNQAPLKYKEN